MTAALEQLIATQVGLVAAFIVAALVVIVSGVRLSIYGDALGDRTGLGSGLVGLIFLAAVTSLPELVVSLTSVIKATDPVTGADLAVGNMLGSNAFNLLILALLALLGRKWFLPENLTCSHTASVNYGLGMLGIFALAFLIDPLFTPAIPWIGCSAATLLLPIGYGIILHLENKRQSAEPEDHLPSEQKLASMPAFRFYGTLTFLCLLIIVGGILLSILGSRMSLSPEQGGFGLEASLIGTLFLAICTSLPELVISFASIRMGFLDMSIGNVLGSNMFNLLIIFAADTAMRGGKILSYASKSNWASTGLILLLTILGMVMLKSNSRKKTSTIAWMMLASYLIVFLLVN